MIIFLVSVGFDNSRGFLKDWKLTFYGSSMTPEEIRKRQRYRACPKELVRAAFVCLSVCLFICLFVGWLAPLLIFILVDMFVVANLKTAAWDDR